MCLWFLWSLAEEAHLIGFADSAAVGLDRISPHVNFAIPFSVTRVRAAHIKASMRYALTVNDQALTVEVDSDTPLLWVLRDELGFKGTKFGCGMGLCGACTVHINGSATRSCVMPISAVGTQQVTTIEGVGSTGLGKKMQDSWLKLDVMQCGYCQAGQIMSACALLAQTPRPSDQDIDSAMSGNICRCATYARIRAAIKDAAGLPAADLRKV